jgi:hypothetical protein
VDNSTRGPSRKKQASQAENQDETYVDVKVFFNLNSKIKTN